MVVWKEDKEKVRKRKWARDRRKHGWNKVVLEKHFVGVDGEGVTLENGYHAYTMLRIGDKCITASQFGQTKLTSYQCLDFLVSQDPSKVYVGYYIDYDITKWVEDLPHEKLHRLINRNLRQRDEGKGTWPLDWHKFQIDYLPHKEFKIRQKLGKSVDPETGEVTDRWSSWVVYNDVGPFFQTKFVDAIEKWGIGSEDDWAKIAKGKQARADFALENEKEIAEYNQLEIRLLEELMRKFRDACFIAGYLPRKWQGPGQLAEAAFRRWDVPLSKDVPLLNDARYNELLTFARNAFYGGRPELSVVGPVDRQVWQWDINSAYPAAMLRLPCLVHGSWERRGKGDVPESSLEGRDNYAICYGTFRVKEGEEHQKALWYGLPFRSKDGSIFYPQEGKGWYWNIEIEGAIHQDFEVEDCWVYRRCCDCVPLGFVEDIYKERLYLGKDSSGLILKLLLNSLYGKCVQSVGFPKYANPIWGSFITAWCRRQIQAFIHSSRECERGRCGRDILMVATDAVATWTERKDMDDSKILGGWSVELHPRGMFFIQPGLYFGSAGKRAKTRGVPVSALDGREAEFRERFEAMVQSGNMEDGDVWVEQRMFVGIRYALARKNMKLLGQWITFGDPRGKRLSFAWTTKRRLEPVVRPGPGQSYILTFPKIGDVNEQTVPYRKDIGGIQERERVRSWFEAQPEWAPTAGPTERDGL